MSTKSKKSRTKLPLVHDKLEFQYPLAKSFLPHNAKYGLGIHFLFQSIAVIHVLRPFKLENHAMVLLRSKTTFEIFFWTFFENPKIIFWAKIGLKWSKILLQNRLTHNTNYTSYDQFIFQSNASKLLLSLTNNQNWIILSHFPKLTFQIEYQIQKVKN